MLRRNEWWVSYKLPNLEESLGEGRSSISDTVTWLRFAVAVVASLCLFFCTLVTNGLSVWRFAAFRTGNSNNRTALSSYFFLNFWSHFGLERSNLLMHNFVVSQVKAGISSVPFLRSMASREVSGILPGQTGDVLQDTALSEVGSVGLVGIFGMVGIFKLI